MYRKIEVDSGIGSFQEDVYQLPVFLDDGSVLGMDIKVGTVASYKVFRDHLSVGKFYTELYFEEFTYPAKAVISGMPSDKNFAINLK